MKIAIISDTHDNFENTTKVFEKIKELGINEIIHCGDVISPFILNKMEEYGKKIHLVFGYQDVNLVTISKSFEGNYKNIVFYKDFGDIEIDGKKIFFIHNNKLARTIAESQKYDAVFHGHNHVANSEMIGKTLLVNPGEILGIKGKPSFAIYDTETNKVEIVEL